MSNISTQERALIKQKIILKGDLINYNYRYVQFRKGNKKYSPDHFSEALREICNIYKTKKAILSAKQEEEVLAWLTKRYGYCLEN